MFSVDVTRPTFDIWQNINQFHSSAIECPDDKIKRAFTHSNNKYYSGVYILAIYNVRARARVCVCVRACVCVCVWGCKYSHLH